jgi:histone deacetylase complex regulatory component SIN3
MNERQVQTETNIKPKEVRGGGNSEEARLKFISKVKETFLKESHIIEKITNLVEQMQKDRMIASEGERGRLETEIETVFKGHPDLLQECYQLLHCTNGGSGSNRNSLSKREWRPTKRMLDSYGLV